MSKKVLFVATVLRMHVLVFHLPYMRWFQEQGYEVLQNGYFLDHHVHREQ